MGSWLTCEETTATTGQPHGYVFEVPADGFGNPAPIRDMGRFSHEAVAIDPVTGHVYETEDAGASLLGFFGASSKSGFYRFIPNVKGQLSNIPTRAHDDRRDLHVRAEQRETAR